MGRNLIKSYAKTLIRLANKLRKSTLLASFFKLRWGVSGKMLELSRYNLDLKIYPLPVLE